MSFVLIQTTTLSTVQASITFSAIPQTYDHLVVVCNTRRNSASGTGSGSVQFNGDTTAGGGLYDNMQMSANGYYTGSPAPSNQMYARSTSYFEAFNCGNNTDQANSFPASTIFIWNYKDTNFYKYGGSHGSQFNNAGYSYQTMYAGAWSSTSAINAVRLFPTSGASFEIGSSATLYGIALAGTGAVVS